MFPRLYLFHSVLGQLASDVSKANVEMLVRRSGSLVPTIQAKASFTLEKAAEEGKQILRPAALLNYNSRKIIEVQSKFSCSCTIVVAFSTLSLIYV